MIYIRSMGTTEPIEAVRAAVKTVKGRGYKIVREDWGVGRSWDGQWETDSQYVRECCPLGAYLVATQPLVEEDDPERATAKALEVSSAWVSGFVHGWDGFLPANYDNDYSLGYYAGKTLAEEEGIR